MEQQGNHELMHQPNVQLAASGRQVMAYGKEFFEWLAWQGYQTSGRGYILLSLKTTEVNYLEIEAISWQPVTHTDFNFGEHSSIARPLLGEISDAHRQLVRTYDPMSEYVVLLADETQLYIFKGLSLWVSQVGRWFCRSKIALSTEEIVSNWVETFNGQHLTIEV